MKVSAQYAQEHLADFLSAADNGEEVEIARPDQSAFRLTLVRSAPKQAGRRILGAGRGELRVPSFEEWQAMDNPSNEPTWSTPERPRAELFGCLKGKFDLSPDWDSPETNQEIADLFERSPIFPDAPPA